MSHVGIVAVSEPSFGGTYQYTLSTIEALRRLPAHHYTLFTTTRNRYYDNLGLPIVRLPGPSAAITRFLVKTLSRSRLRGLFSEVDKVIAPIYTTFLLASSRPFAFTLHDLQERHFPGRFSYKQRIWRYAANRLLARAATRIICESTYVKGDIHKFFGVDVSRIAVIPAPPVSIFRSKIERTQLDLVRQRFGIPERYLLYPAQFLPHKNHARLVDAFALVVREYPDCHLLFTGDKRFEHHRVMSRVTELGLIANVHHLGQISAADLLAVYKMATIVVVPTLYESISIPIFEAFGAGVPVCASNILALPEQVGDAAVLFDPLSVNDIAGKLVSLLGDESLRQKLAQRGTRRINALNVEQYAAALEDLLASLEPRRS